MGDIGADIREAFTEVGRDFVIQRPAGDVEGEYLLLDADYYATISNLQLKVNFFWDTQVVSGDLIRIDSRRFVVSSVQPNEEEHEVYLQVGEIFECNVTGSISRHSETTPYYDPQTFRLSPSFAVVYATVYGCLAEPVSPKTLYRPQMTMLTEGEQVLMLPSYYNVIAEDRLTLAGGSVIKIVSVESRINTQMKICHVEKDVRIE